MEEFESIFSKERMQDVVGKLLPGEVAEMWLSSRAWDHGRDRPDDSRLSFRGKAALPDCGGLIHHTCILSVNRASVHENATSNPTLNQVFDRKTVFFRGLASSSHRSLLGTLGLDRRSEPAIQVKGPLKDPGQVFIGRSAD